MKRYSDTLMPPPHETAVAHGPAGALVTRRPVALGVVNQFALLVGGAALIGAVIAVLLWNDLGPGPVDAFIAGIHSRTGLPISGAIWITFGVINAVAWAMGRRPGVGTLLAPLVAGLVIEVVLSALDNVERADMLVARVALQVVAIGLVGIGVGAMIASRLGAGPPELLASALSDRTGLRESVTRTGFEVSCLIVAVPLGGPVGLGTLLVAVLIGPAVLHGRRVVDGALAAPGRRRRQYARCRDRENVDGASAGAETGAHSRRLGQATQTQEPCHDDRRARRHSDEDAVPRHQRRLAHHRATRLLRRQHRPRLS
jgi:uncharacterized membrane protein YczE